MTSPPTDALGPPRADAAALTTTMTVVFAGVTLITPLLPAYGERWELSVSATAVLFSSYVPGVVTSLVVFGRLADVIGERVVVAVAVALADVAAVAALVAGDEGWLLAARVVHGLAVGLVPGAVSLALVGDVTPAVRARLLSFATTGGIAAGLLLGAALAGAGTSVAWGVYLVLLAASTVWAFTGAARAARPEHGARWRLQLPVVPQQQRGRFVLALAGAAVTFAAMGLFAGLGPTLVAGRAHAVLVGASVAALAYLVSGAAQFTGGAPLVRMRTGALVLVAGVAALTVAVDAGSIAVLLVSALLVGAGNGLIFPPTIGAAQQLAPPGRQAGAVSTYYLALYAGIAVPLVGLGALVDATSLRAGVLVFALVIAAACAALVWQSHEPSARAGSPNPIATAPLGSSSRQKESP